MTRKSEDADGTGALWKLIKGMRIAMLTTLDDHGNLRSRPMATLPHAGFEDGTLWFFTKADSAKVSELERHWRVNLSYADPKAQNYVSVSGVAEVVRDRERIEDLWREAMTIWFPQGPDDPEVALLKVTVDQAEYWDSPSATMVFAYGYLKAKLTGERPHPGSHGTVRFRPDHP